MTAYHPRTASLRIAAAFRSCGEADYIGEPVSIIQHSLQVAALAKEAGDDEITVAGLLHDIGHVVGMEAGNDIGMDGCGIVDHEHIGADFAATLGFSERIQRMIRNHISAKRYLCAIKPEYYESLSDASKTTLKFQGGVMTADEVSSYEADPDHTVYIQMRSWDEQAKVPGKDVPSLESYFPIIDALSTLNANSSMCYPLTTSQLDFWNQNSFLKISNLIDFHGISASTIEGWVREISQWEKTQGKWLLHWEAVGDDGLRTLCRAENFVNYHEGMRELCMDIIRPVVSQLFGEDAALFKEKINFKLPGGSGFSAHQDSPAYIGMASQHISVMVAIDEATIENGCLQVAPGQWRKGQVPLDSKGVITPEAEENMTFKYVLSKPGDVFLFSGYLPHRSGANTSDKSRRAMFITYNPSAEGDFHEAYYVAKHTGAQGFSSSQTISFQGDFQGKIID